MPSSLGQPGTRSPMDSSRGFSLIELLIVVAIILIIAAIAIPNFMRSRMAANEAAAVTACRKITTANVVYATTYGMGYAPTLLALGPPSGGGAVGPNSAGLLDEILVSGQKHGYTYDYDAPDDGSGIRNTFTVSADPVQYQVTGSRYFFIDQTGVVRSNSSARATAADDPI